MKCKCLKCRAIIPFTKKSIKKHDNICYGAGNAKTRRYEGLFAKE